MPKDLNSNKNPIYLNFKTKGKRKLVIFKHTHPVYLSQSKTGHIATENHSHNFQFPLALLLRFIVSFSSSLKLGGIGGGGGGGVGVYLVITIYTILVQKWGVGAYMVMGAYKVLYSNVVVVVVIIITVKAVHGSPVSLCWTSEISDCVRMMVEWTLCHCGRPAIVLHVLLLLLSFQWKLWDCVWLCLHTQSFQLSWQWAPSRLVFGHGASLVSCCMILQVCYILKMFVQYCVVCKLMLLLWW